MSNQVNSTYSPHISSRIFHYGGKQKRQKGVSPNSSSSREVCSASMTDDAAEKEERATSFQALHGQRDSAKAASRCAHSTPGKGGIVRSEAERPTKEKVVDIGQRANGPSAPTIFVHRVKQLEERVITMVVSGPTCRNRSGW
jgi:hypothetical protein